MPKVSVIVPNYNHASFLQQRIESILNQTYQDFELIILDDCSTDNSKGIIEQYRNHPKVSRISYNIENSGSTFRQWEKGIHLSQGEYIWIAESDDWCEPTLLETLAPKLDLNKDIVLGYVQSYCIDGNEIQLIYMQDYLERNIEGYSFIKQHLLFGNSIYNASMAIFRKSVFYKISSDYTKLKFCGDWLFWGSIASYGDVFVSGKILNYFRNHPNDVSTKSYKAGLNYIEVIEVLNNFYTRGYIKEIDLKIALYAQYKSFVKGKVLIPPENAREILKKFERHIKLEIYYPVLFKFKRKLKILWKHSVKKN